MMSCKYVRLKVLFNIGSYLEISSLYSDFIANLLNIPVNNSYEDIPELMLDPMS